MKIAIVCDVLGEENNGTTIAAMNLVRYLKSKEHEVHIVCPNEQFRGRDGYYIVPKLGFGPLNGYVAKNGVEIAKADKKVLEEALSGVDVIHVLIPMSLGHAAAVYAKEHNIPLTAGFHCQAENISNHFFLMNDRFINKSLYKWMYNYCFKYVDAIHYPSQFIRDVFESVVGPTEGRVISNGVNQMFRRERSERPEEFKNKFVILFTGRYSKEKSHKVLIDAVSMSDYNDIIQLVFAGGGPQHDNIRQYCERRLTNPPIMKFFPRDEMNRVVNSADLYVHPAEIEIEAIACLEAISCGIVPVISDSPRSATRFFALEENNLFKCNDAADLAQKINYWIEHPAERARCSEKYIGYTARFEQQKCMEELEQMIIETAKKKP